MRKVEMEKPFSMKTGVPCFGNDEPGQCQERLTRSDIPHSIAS